MTRTWIAHAVAIGSVLILLAGSAFADPIEVAEHKDPQSGDVFELFQDHDGSFFCSVQRRDGSLTGFEIQEDREPAAAEGAGDRPDIRNIAKNYYKKIQKNDVKATLRKTHSSRDTSRTGWSTGAACPICQYEDKLSYPHKHENYRDHDPNVCYHQGNTGRSENQKTVGLILLLMLSELDAS
ncbi:MAG: hypothetical protein K9M82_01515 [Deltaproteobacteria bacterium]|nr:hypothetical protein [Deltaproteobacteria bacterium]